MKLDELQKKKLAIVGMGVNNRKMSEYFTRHQISYDVIQDWKNPDELIGKLNGYDVIFRTPGLPYLTEAMQQAKQSGAEISSQTKMFFSLCPAPIIGVTGTKGKGTTSSLIAEILKAAEKKVFLAGNFGRDPFEFLDELSSGDLVVLELSSFQLQDMETSPHIAVVLNITPDHMNHHRNMDEYVQAKLQIVANQKAGDYAVLHPSLPREFAKAGDGRKIFFDPAKVSNWNTKLLGTHNFDNIAAATAVTEILGVSQEIIKSAVAKFEPLPHRLKILGTYGGITYIDDGFSTNIEPTVAAIDALPGPLILIAGGSDKKLDFSPLVEKINNTNKIKGLVAIGAVADKIAKGVSGPKVLTGAANMKEIMAQAVSLAENGDTILFSPATASFGMFKNEYDRAEQFVSAVESLKR